MGNLKIVVAGAGAAGLMAAIHAAECGAQVTLLEKMSRVGKKLSITGKGRCNLTNIVDVPELIEHIPGNGKFLNSVLNSFTSIDTINFFESLGVATKLERGGRVFPMSDNAAEVVEALLKRMRDLGVELRTNTRVINVLTSEKQVVAVESNRRIDDCDAVILAMGGASYPATGSTGDGFAIAKRLGHTIVKLLPSLVPLETEEDFVQELQGVSLKNVRVELFVEGVKAAEEFGEMLFTHFGVSGPIILTLSRRVAFLLEEGKFIELSINLKPALAPEQLDARVLRDLEKNINKSVKNALTDLLPAKLIPILLDLSFIDEDKRANSVTVAERKRLVEALQDFRLTISKTRPISEAIVTAGGVSTKEIDPRTMQSKIIDGLYFAGEVVDVDGFTGGYNLQAAFAMAVAAAEHAAQRTEVFRG
ncbi:MAG: NAD(P)/FAD-dependent oxidoreductase [Selenomonadaceae bacterium]|nr:NAD(P)/FAD-dependent oxidoreductase [Selenomonadaceae bacterium]